MRLLGPRHGKCRGCQEDPNRVTTTGMVRDMVAALVGSDADVHAIMGAGVDTHLFQPARSASVRILDADIVVYNGLHLEGRLGEVLERRQKTAGTTIAVGETLAAEKLMNADAGLHDPHIWMDVALWSDATGMVAQALAEAMPDHADAIRQRADAYRRQLAQLDQWGHDAIQSIPPSQRVLVTAHDAFRYFGRRDRLRNQRAPRTPKLPRRPEQARDKRANAIGPARAAIPFILAQRRG